MEDRRLATVTGVSMVSIFLGVAVWFPSFTVGKPLWGILLTDFLYFASITQGALAITIILRVASARWSAYFYRLALATALAFSPAGLIMLLQIFIAKNDIFYWAEEAHTSPWFNAPLFFSRHLVLFILFYLIVGKLWWISRDAGLGKLLNNRLLVTGFIFLIVFVAYETILSWDFGMTLNKGFADTAYAVIFILGSVYAGTALLVILMAAAKKYLGAQVFDHRQFESLAQVLLALSIFWFYVWYTQFFSIWFVNLPEETEPIYLRIFHGYGYIFFPSITLISVIPFLALIFKKVRDSVAGVSMVSASILIGFWLDRYLIVIPSLIKEEKITQTAMLHPVNVFFTLGVIGGITLVFIRLLRAYPMTIPIEHHEAARDPIIAEPTGWQ